MNVSFSNPVIYSKIAKSNITFGTSASKLPSLRDLDPDYTTPKSKNNTVIILGSSSDSKALKPYTKKADEIAYSIVLSGRNTLTCGLDDSSLVGIAYKGALDASKEPYSGKNLAIVTEGLPYNENIKDCLVIGKAKSEEERTDKFAKCANTIIALPGRETTIQEVSQLIQKNAYSDDKKKIILVDNNYYKGLKLQYKTMEKADQLKGQKASNLFTVVDSVKEAMAELPEIIY